MLGAIVENVGCSTQMKYAVMSGIKCQGGWLAQLLILVRNIKRNLKNLPK